jgi:hypothetical protein
MLKFKISQSDFDQLDEGMQKLYTSREDGTFALEVDGIEDKSADVEKLKNALEAERRAHKETKLKTSTTDPKPKPTDPTIDPAVQNELLSLKNQMKQMRDENEALQKEKFIKGIEEQVIKKASNKIRTEAIDDLLIYTKNTEFLVGEDGNILTKTGKTVDEFVDELVGTKKHWLKPSIPGNAAPGTGTPPASAKKRYDELMSKDTLTTAESAEAMKLLKEIK